MIREYPLISGKKRKIMIWALVIIGLRESFILSAHTFAIPVTKAWFISFFVFAGALYAIIHALTERIIVSPSGITIQVLDFATSLKWEDAVQIKQYPIFNYEALSFQGKVNITDTQGTPNSEIFWDNPSINLSRYSENWRDSEIGQQIKQYAPHLFEKEKSA